MGTGNFKDTMMREIGSSRYNSGFLLDSMGQRYQSFRPRSHLSRPTCIQASLRYRPCASEGEGGLDWHDVPLAARHVSVLGGASWSRCAVTCLGRFFPSSAFLSSAFLSVDWPTFGMPLFMMDRSLVRAPDAAPIRWFPVRIRRTPGTRPSLRSVQCCPRFRRYGHYCRVCSMHPRPAAVD